MRITISILLLSVLLLGLGGLNAQGNKPVIKNPRTTIPSANKPMVIQDPNAARINAKLSQWKDLQRARIPGRTGSNGKPQIPGRTGSNGKPATGNSGSNSAGSSKPAESAPEKEVDIEELERVGPDNKPFNLLDNIGTDVGSVANKLLGLYKGTVYRDGNIKSGYYYYLPKAYHLGWSPVTGEYDFEATYGKTDENGNGRTTITATLYPDLTDQDIAIARTLLKADIKGKPEGNFPIQELMAMPMRETPTVEFTNLSMFGVTAQDIGLRAPSDLTDPIVLTFSTNQTDALMAMFFNNVGVYGEVVISPAGDGMQQTIRIPVNLKIDAPETFGNFELLGTNWRKAWRNPTDYPVHLGHLHVLRKERTGYRVYSWKAGGQEVPEGANVNFGTASIPSWIDRDTKVERVWLDYSIAKCDGCKKRVKKKILGSLSQDEVAKPEQLEFTILTPMAFTEASLMRIKIRSFQATAMGDQQQELPSITVNEDGTVMDGGTLYVRDGKVDYEYRLQVYLEDGTKYESGWISSNSKEVVIGKRQIQDNIPEFADR